MPTTSAVSAPTTDQTNPTTTALSFRRPTPDDGAQMWRLARDTGVLDLNASYAYVMWGHDFADTSLVAELDGRFAGFITGYTRPSAPETLMIWQVATEQRFRGRGIAIAMLQALFDRCQRSLGVDRLATTITADNVASNALFAKFAQTRDLPASRSPLFTADIFPDPHDTEFLHLIGPAN